MSTNPEEPSGYADLLGSDSDPTLRRLVDDLDALYSAPTPPAHLSVPPVTARPVTTVAASAPPAPWASLPGGRDAAPRRVPVRRPLAWQPLLRVAALTVLLLGGLLTVVLGITSTHGGSGLPIPFTPTPMPAADRFAQITLQSLRFSVIPGGEPPVVVLNRRLGAGDLACLGLPSVPGLPADEPLRLVIVHGYLDPGDDTSVASAYSVPVHYIGFVYVERQAALTLRIGSPNGGAFRRALNDPTLPDDRMHIAHPLEEWARHDPLERQVLAGTLGQAFHASQTQGAWTVTLERIYVDTNRVVVLYTVRGPTMQVILSTPVVVLSTGEELPMLETNGDGPTTDGAGSTWRGLTLFSAQDLAPHAQWTLRITVPTIKSLSVYPTPTVPACGPPLPADPGTPLPTWTPGPPVPPVATATAAEVAPPGPSVTPVLVGTATPPTVLAGPFTFTLTVPVIPSTSLPQPQPTAPGGLPQAVPSAGPTTPLPAPR